MPQHATAQVARQRTLLRYQRTHGNRLAQHILQRQEEGATNTQSGLLVEDDAAELNTGQMRKGAFLTQLRNAVKATIDETLTGSPLAIFVKPRIDQQVSQHFSTYQNYAASALESTIRREAPATRQATTASKLIPPICQEVRRAVGQYLPTGNSGELGTETTGEGGGLIDRYVRKTNPQPGRGKVYVSSNLGQTG